MTSKVMAGVSPVLLDVTRLRVGDVLLTTQASLTSAFIRNVTWSDYSHILLHLGNGLVVESTPDKGVRMKTLELKKVEPRQSNPAVGENRYKVLVEVPDATLVHVFRHKSLAGERGDPEEIELSQKIFMALQNRWGTDYSLLTALGHATTLLSSTPKLKHAILRTVGKLGPDKNKEVPGDFCSQLVGNIFGDLGLAPFNLYGPDELPSPGSFSDEEHNQMMKVHDVHDSGDDSIPGDMERLKRELDIQRSQHINVVALNSTVKGQRWLINELSKF